MPDRESTNDSPAEASTKRKRPRLRRVGVIVGCLLAGAIINVLVAWGCATVVGNLRSDALLVELEAFLARRYPATRIEREDISGGGFIMRRVWQPPEDPAARRLESRWYTVESVSDSSTMTTTLWVGWPARALRTQFDDRRPHTLRASSFALAFTSPLWPGFLINTMFYGAFVWMLFALSVAVRRHWREKRNRCPDCGYDLRGADHGKCPECGEAVVSQRRQPNSRTAKQVVD